MAAFLKSPLTISTVVEPVKFFCNTATCADNYFQVNDAVSGDPLAEHRQFVSKLKCVAPGCVASFALADEERIAPRLEEIIGKKVSILMNLAPRKIRGVESQGMILMAENAEGKLSFVSPEEGFEAGGEVR